MRIAGKILRWVIIIVGVIEILFNLGSLSGNGDVPQGQAVGLALFWATVVGLVFYIDARSNKKHRR